MSERSPKAAFEALRDVPKPDALAELARAVVIDGATGDAVREKGKELGLDDGAKTPFGECVAVLARGPEDDAERTLSRALAALALASADDAAVTAELVVRLAGTSAFDPSSLLDDALGDRADALFASLGARASDHDAPRQEALVACAVLRASKRASAKRELAALASSKALDPLVRASLPTESVAETRVAGELVPAPRNPLLTVLLGVTGLLFVASAVRLLMRLVLAYRVPAEVSASPVGVRIRARTEVLGRTLRDREIVIGAGGLARAVREVRFPRLGLYVGLLALAIGTYIGIGAFADGVRAASPSLLFWGVVLVAAGIALDFVLSSIRFGAKGKCRLVLAPRKGRAVCIGDVDPKRADAALAALAQG